MKQQMMDMQTGERKRTVGLITMHKVLNYGSALQAYALQEVVQQLGYQVEIIDYIYPNAEHRLYWELPKQEKCPKRSILQRIDGRIRQLINNLLGKKEECINEKAFLQFYHRFFHLSAEKYATRYWLGKNPPIYDIYLTGSDQVWNPSFIGYDTSFMLSFVQGTKPKISYAASFSISTLPSQYQDCYQHELGKYSSISVREPSGTDIIETLLSKEAEVVCDPTLLLEKEQWIKIAETANYNIEEPYMLLYILDYAYNPYPQIFHLIEALHSKLNLRMVVLHGKMNEYMEAHQAICIDNAGPADFIKLFSAASFVVTTSFHGTAFALILGIPFCSIIRDDTGNKDSRIIHLLKRVGAEKHALLYDQPLDNIEQIKVFDEQINKNLKQFRKQSLAYLEKALSSATNKINNQK